MAPIAENHLCCLLTNEENLQVFKLLGNRCQTLCTTVIQLFLTQAPNHNHWIKKTTGVLCFVKDNTKKNFFFRVFCLKKNIKVWEHELYINMDYIVNSSLFHMFEGEEGLVAFNFANLEEANDCRIIVHQKINAQKRRVEKRTRAISQTLPPSRTNIDYSGFKKVPDIVAKQNKRKRNITKADIGIPKDFKHISHVGWNSNSGFDIDTDDEQLKAFFKQAGISEKQLQDKKTRDYIYDFINQNGGIEVVKKSVVETNVTPPAVPPRGPTRSTHLRNAPPPPVPVKNNNLINIRSKTPPENISRKPPPVIGSAPNVPPPPPPPPIFNSDDVNIPPPPPPPMVAPPSPRSDGGMSAELLKSIRSGTTLKPPEERKPVIDDARGDLLSEIRKGCKLRPVDERDVKSNPPPQPAKTNDLASALAKALAKRNEVIHSEDDDDKSDDSSDMDEWDD